MYYYVNAYLYFTIWKYIGKYDDIYYTSRNVLIY
nr:MAG TPA: hypothetical protein [Caudoviricetes sp.]